MNLFWRITGRREKMNDKYIELAKKLNILANEGVAEGERYNAKAALDSLMEKYNITMEDIDESTLLMTKFYSPEKYDYLFFQVAFSVVGDKRNCGTLKANKNYKVIEVTKFEELEIRAKWNFYRKAFDEQAKIFMGAFILKNRLYSKADPNEPEQKLTPEQIELIKKSQMMSLGMEGSNYLIQINK